MRVLCVGDPHYSDRNLVYITALEKKVIEIAKEGKTDIVVIMGDTLDKHRKIDGGLLNRAINFFDEVSKFCPIFVLIGNHDYFDNKQNMTNNHCFYCIKERKGKGKMFIVDKVRNFTFNKHNMSMCFVPYVPNGELEKALIESTSYEVTDNLACVFGHQEIKGCDMGYTESKSGDMWHKSNPMFISGHIHKHHIIGDNVFYVGTAYQTTISEDVIESGEKKGLVMMEIEKKDKDDSKENGKINHRGFEYKYEFIPISIKQRKKSIFNTENYTDYEEESDIEQRIIIEDEREKINAHRKEIDSFFSKQNIYGKVCFKPVYNTTYKQITDRKVNIVKYISEQLDDEQKLLLSEMLKVK